MSGRALEVLNEVGVVAGYTTYIDLIRPLIAGKELIQTGMKKEVDRVEAAIDRAVKGTACAIVSSGDPGVYAMAGLAFEICRKRNLRILAGKTVPDSLPPESLYIEVVPGIPALCSAASLLGAPLTHDFAAVSLSDLLTPWEVIEKRLAAAAEADFVIVLYNPKSKKRTDHLERAQRIILRHRNPDTPAGVVTGAMREDERVGLTTLGELHLAEVDMQTTVIIGNGSTFLHDGVMVTPRGYAAKYGLI